MNQYLKTIQDLLQKNNQLAEQDREALLKAIIDADKQWNITDFKLDRTEKVKKTTAILLEETIAELEKKRKAIEDQNRELEIEGSLERVRSVAMGMKTPEDMLDVCKTIAQQLRLLKVKEIRNVQTGIFYESNGSYTNYEFYAKHDKVFITDVDYKNHRVAEKFATQMLKGPNEVFVHGFKGNEVRDWLDYQKTMNVFIDTYLETAESLTYYWYSLGPVALGISTYSPLNEDEINLFKRFRNVFELAYRRYLDIEKAEAQAREAKIEAALEKIRSRSLAMRQADEIVDVITVVREKLKELNIAMQSRTVLIITLTKGSKDFTQWVASPGGSSGQSVSRRFETPYFDHPILRDFWAARETGSNFLAKIYTKEEKDSFFKFVFEHTERKNATDDEKTWILNATDYTISAAIEQNSAIIVTNFCKELLTDKENEVLQRFARVFEQAYIRFLDLKKAEAQAREAKIEAALEKVRSRTMAMQRSTELAEVATVLFQQVKALGVPQWACGFCIWEINDKEFIWYPGDPDGKILAQSRVPLTEHQIFQSWVESKRRGDELFIYEKTDDVQVDHYRYMMTVPGLRESLQDMLDAGFTFPSFQIDHVANFSHGNLLFITYEPFPEMHDVFKRFAKVFEQTYTRFLDLQKAEAQAREAQIEAALEKVRSRSLAMHKSDELQDVVRSVFERLDELNVELNSAIIIIFLSDSNDMIWWLVNRMSEQFSRVVVKYKDLDYFRDLFKVREKGQDLLTRSYPEDKKRDFFSYLFEETDFKSVPDERKQFILQSRYFTISTALARNTGIQITSYSKKEFSDQENEILKRFVKVFDQSYTRFLDLQRAEAQAREGQIETALEKVRSRSLAMHKSDELQDVVNTVFERLRELGVDFYTAIILVFQEDSKDIVWWLQNKENQQYPRILVPYSNISYLEDLFKARKEKKELLAKNYVFKEKNELFDHLFSHTNFKNAPQKQKDFLFNAEFATMCVGLAQNTGIHLTSYTRPSFSDEEHAIVKRFAKVFDQTYTRFLDLQKAEAQAREAQIEAALEKVRSRSLAMHHSEELQQVVASLFDRFIELGVSFDGAGIYLFQKETRNIQLWIATTHLSAPAKIELPYDKEIENNPINIDLWRAFESGEHIINRSYSGKAKNDYFRYVAKYNKIPESVRQLHMQRDWMAHFVAEKNSLVGFDSWSGQSISDEDFQIAIRFARVFEQAYTRFLDLQKAEAQARAAKIESAMEKVRARAMAMQKPAELVEVAQLLRMEMGLLGVEELETSSIYIHDEDSGTTECWYAIQDIRDGDKKLVADHMTINLGDTWVGREMLKFYRSDQMQTSIPMKGENRKEWIDYCSKHSKLLQDYYGETIPERTYHLLKFSNGYMGAASPGEISAESWELLKRATNVFSLAYTRFSDLQLAEANAREAVKQSVLDRIRADIASMRTTSDLDRITPLIWNELTILGVPFIRCGVFIMDDSQQLIHTFLSTPDGKAIAAFHLSYNSTKNLTDVVSHWRERRVYINHWDKSEFITLADGLVTQGAIANRQDYVDKLPPGGLFLHFLPFLQGMLYVGNLAQLHEDELKLLQSVADAFSTAYARYEDFNRLEAAKQQVDKTLFDLRQAQTQLVQSEKMASLGELTAGIAHEIQNPLNFVNNFSDVSNELLDEMKTELEQGNKKDAIALVEDVKQNLEKILHHGRRADAIVKGMLQHSRISSGQKELTDINILADEYLRLAYHGLRAKDKSFNAKFESDFDTRLDRINIIPQDIGRVILNLINNAFYSVNEKRKQNSISGYEPTVRVSTKRDDGKVEIRVADNGNGIPQKILDKIFQPFFTTKPTGQGTGLGLSLSYDIIRAHGGEITVRTREGEGSEFTITIPSM